MAAPRKNTAPKSLTSPVEEGPIAPQPVQRPARIRLILGSLLLISGAFLLLSIFSYLFTWQRDQSLVAGHPNLSGFLLHENAPTQNWGGRLGTAISHLLVFRGFGLASAAVGLWLMAGGLHLVWGKRGIPFMRYLRWLALVLLVLAPLLTYFFPDSNFPWGGALGNEAVVFLNGLLGKMGTGLILLSAALFVAIAVFALDVRPWIRKARRAARAAYGSVVPTSTKEAAKEEEEVPAGSTPGTDTDALPAEVPALHTAEVTEAVGKNVAPLGAEALPKATDTKSSLKLHLAQLEAEKGALPPTPAAVAAVAAAVPEPITEVFAEDHFAGEPADEREDKNDLPAELELILPVEEKAAPSVTDTPAEPTLSLEVVQLAEAPAPTIAGNHGAHVSIADKEPYAPELDLPDYKFPTLDLLEARGQEAIALDKDELEKNKTQIIQTLRSFGIEIQRISATVGPTVTLYEIVPAEGVRISKIRNLEDDIALNLAALGIRIIAPIPGKGTIGIEVPNAHKQIVAMRTLLESEKFVNAKMSLPVALGKTISNDNYIVDLATMPHLLMAGATGQGKSVGINAILVSLLYKKHPSQLKFVMVDPKKVELSIYKTIEKHFLAKLPNEEEAIITDTRKVIHTLNALCIEMDNRYELLKEAGTRNIKEYNDKFIARRLNPERGHKYLPFIVLVVDEFADLIMTAGKEVEMPIARLAQLARAVGIHLIIATQRPSVNVITGTIKANFPGRAAFKVSAKVDSRTILDAGGAEQLIGRGDMLVSHGSELLRVQCAFVDTPEVERIVEFIGSQKGYASAFELPEYEGEDGDTGSKEAVDLSTRDKMFSECARIVVQLQSGSTSMLQRRLNLGYNRAGRIMDQLEAAGIVGATNGSKPREVLYQTEHELDDFLQSLG
jgi:S-DNA-T family DNA segregation ATPase FtsK/SpoIIIE